MKLLEDDESTNPMLSVVNLLDVFLIIIAALMIAIAQNPMNPFNAEDVTIIKNAGKKDMEIIIKKGVEVKKYQSVGEIGAGQGTKAGVAYKMADGSIIYIPE